MERFRPGQSVPLLLRTALLKLLRLPRCARAATRIPAFPRRWRVAMLKAPIRFFFPALAYTAQEARQGSATTQGNCGTIQRSALLVFACAIAPRLPWGAGDTARRQTR